MEILSEPVEEYLRALSRTQHRSDVLEEMEERARDQGFPIVGPAVGRLLELQARTIAATRVMELGSGYGYSAYWFARAVGPGGLVVCTDGDERNRDAAEGYLTRAGLWDR